MKMRNSLYALALSVVFAGCSTGVVSDDPEPVVPESKVNLSVRVKANVLTRADENAISTLYLAFYKSGQNPEFICLEKASVSESGDKYTVELPVSPLNLPDMVVAFANIADQEKMKNALASSPATIGEIVDGDNLAMSTAVYFAGSGNSSQLVNYTRLSTSDFNSETPVEITLERIAAKVTVKTATNLQTSTPVVQTPAGNSKQLTLSIDSWGLTATDPESFLIKQVKSSYSELETLLGNWDWNVASNSTLKWAESVNYSAFAADPEISVATFGTVSNDFSAAVYTHETTRSADDLKAVNSKPSIVITGHYTSGDEEMATFYRLRSTGKDFIYTDDEFWQSFDGVQDLVYVKNESDELEKASADDFVLKTPSGITSDCFVTPQLVEGNYAEDKYFNADGETYTLEALNEALYSRFKLLEKYDEGKCVFVIPIEHYKSDASTIYGVVRNHGYTLTLNSISGFGRGVASPESKITDEPDPVLSDSYTINASLKIADWTEISQDVNVSK